MSEAPSRQPVTIRKCEPGDVPAIQRIYAHHVLHGLASFELDPPDEAEMARRRQNILAAGYPYFVAERDGEILGYGYAGPYRTRPAYRFTAENSVYIRHDLARQGIGRRLLAALIAACESQGLRQLVAVIGDSANHASIELHRAAGFAMIGTIRGSGYKSGRWVDTVLMQKALGPGDAAPPETQGSR
jgi:phosphinothricin acetyltransferase